MINRFFLAIAAAAWGAFVATLVLYEPSTNPPLWGWSATVAVVLVMAFLVYAIAVDEHA